MRQARQTQKQAGWMPSAVPLLVQARHGVECGGPAHRAPMRRRMFAATRVFRGQQTVSGTKLS